MTSAKVTPLQCAYTFSFMRRGKGASATDAAAAGKKEENAAATSEPNPYENAIKTITTVGSVEEFWAVYDFLKRPSDLTPTTDYHIFRSGTKPTWEDPNNKDGGKWIVRLPKGLASRYWEEITLALIGQQFLGVPDGEVCGAVLSVRYNEDILGVWNKSASDRECIEKIRDAIKKILQLPPHANMEYKPHQNSMADRSSFRNTTVWKPKSLEGRTAGGAAAAGGAEARRSSWAEREERKAATTKATGRDTGTGRWR
ncbi:hypothetical protein MPSEU_000820500 [Mayamaea pseudoterrestris]|nr:hypothetical protein MPSEU_000820500 [Mayamaea pseudoterrestris]